MSKEEEELADDSSEDDIVPAESAEAVEEETTDVQSAEASSPTTSEEAVKAEEVQDEKKKKKKKKGRFKALTAEFKNFISKGNVLDMAVGVIIGSAFNDIVTAFTNILLAVCTWGVPGGLSGLITVLPIMSSDQVVPSDITVGGQALQQVYTASEWATLSQCSDFTETISDMYTAYGSSYYYNKMAIIDWGSFINAVITFLIIALTLFVIVKVYSYMKKRRAKFEESLKEHIHHSDSEGEETETTAEAESTADATAQAEPAAEAEPVAAVETPPDKTELQLLQEIRDELAKLNPEVPVSSVTPSGSAIDQTQSQ